MLNKLTCFSKIIFYFFYSFSKGLFLKHKAFISYKHSASQYIAIAFESSLKKYVRPTFKFPYKIFRDEMSIQAGKPIGKSIRTALEQSDKLIIILTKDRIEFDLNTENKNINWEKTDALPDLLKETFITDSFGAIVS